MQLKQLMAELNENPVFLKMKTSTPRKRVSQVRLELLLSSFTSTFSHWRFNGYGCLNWTACSWLHWKRYVYWRSCCI